jgi:hypothetical protein
MEGARRETMKVEVLCRGFPGKADVGFWALSIVALITAESERYFSIRAPWASG